MLIDTFGRFIAESGYEDLPSKVVEAVKLRVLDGLASAFAGHRLGHHHILMPLVSGVGQATIWGIGPEFTPREAALVNSFMTHSAFLEDGSRYTGGHPSAVVIPSALALGEERHVAGRDLVVAVAAGYDVFLRLGRAIYPSTVRRGFQSTAVLGAVASAAACGSLLGRDPATARNAIAIACCLGSGLKEGLKSTVSAPLQVARSCEGGMLAALLAAAGAVGADAIIEDGLLKAFCGRADTTGLTDGLGRDFRIGETYLKPHAGCRGNHAPIDLVLALLRTHALAPAAIARIRLWVDSVTLAADVAEPVNGAQAQFSIPWSVALAVLDGQVTPFQYEDARLADPRLRDLALRIDVAADPDLDRSYPDERGARAEIVSADGRRVAGAVRLARGEPENPLAPSEVEEKFLGIARPALGSNAERVRDLVMDLERLPDIGLLSVRLSREPGPAARPSLATG